MEIEAWGSQAVAKSKSAKAFIHSLKIQDSASSSTMDISLVDNLIPFLVDQLDNDILTALPSGDEGHKTVISMDSAPGSDGFPRCFYHKCWGIDGKDVIDRVQSFFYSGNIPLYKKCVKTAKLRARPTQAQVTRSHKTKLPEKSLSNHAHQLKLEKIRSL